MNRYRLLAATAAVLAAGLGVLAPAAPAAAHTELKSTVPAARSTTTKVVTEVKLTFSGLIKKPGTTVTVTGADKTSYSAGDAEVLDKTITQPVDALPVGAVTVAWRTVAADGHPMQGSFTFTNRARPPAPSVEPSPSPSPVAEATTAAPPAAATSAPAVGLAGDEEERSGSGVVWWIAGAAVLLLAATGGLLWHRRRAN